MQQANVQFATTALMLGSSLAAFFVFLLAVYIRFRSARARQVSLGGNDELVLNRFPDIAAEFDYVFLKRLGDLTLSAAGLIALAPVMLAIAMTTWLRSGLPVFFSQERVGRAGRRFYLYKFRSLPVSDFANSYRRWAPPPADSWGRFLRQTGLDELPQLFNVLRGDMSLVGPRPERPYFVEQFLRELPTYSTRHSLQAGITGWAQVNSLRGDTSIPRRVEYDLYYLRHWSLSFDLCILWMTLKNLARHLWQWLPLISGPSDARSV